ncbi:hypothetical protein RchiOBHm_Chr6g0254871 [Rosa chinensis]|uniref:Uncharacterized protein n=1 Tax=Rosa chinensis TaxID=74649 RepID=A0A2P6PLQ4_ROSCH|nr:hypothetical protein RchiOBHm_Chr6g0254871 [Rosa chinensis]
MSYHPVGSWNNWSSFVKKQAWNLFKKQNPWRPNCTVFSSCFAYYACTQNVVNAGMMEENKVQLYKRVIQIQLVFSC